MFNGGGTLIFPNTFVTLPSGMLSCNNIDWEWGPSTLQRLGKAQALRVYIYIYIQCIYCTYCIYIYLYIYIFIYLFIYKRAHIVHIAHITKINQTIYPTFPLASSNVACCNTSQHIFAAAHLAIPETVVHNLSTGPVTSFGMGDISWEINGD